MIWIASKNIVSNNKDITLKRKSDGNLYFCISTEHRWDQGGEHFLILPCLNRDMDASKLYLVIQIINHNDDGDWCWFWESITWERVEAASGRIKRTTLNWKHIVTVLKKNKRLHLFWTSWVNMFTGTSLSREGIPKSYARTLFFRERLKEQFCSFKAMFFSIQSS